MRNWKEITEARDVNRLIEATGEWRKEKGFHTGWDNFAEKLMLIITELAESDAAFDIVARELTIDYDNLTEEWIDVCVRIFDLMEACGLTAKPDLIKVLLEKVDEEIREDYKYAIEEENLMENNKKNCWSSTLQIADAMEEFRDVTIKAGTAEINNKTQVKIQNITKSLFNVIIEAYFVVELLGKSWWETYCLKMEKNEKRTSKHGRQR
ncbi:MAG: hypothetical protein KAX49_15260 [Halanaerobiales bacterium]|nr:hypothetical protein [Halanaerobiales bacterium]